MTYKLDSSQRLDIAKSSLQRMADTETDLDKKICLSRATTALGEAEDRIYALEWVVRALSKKAGIGRADVGFPIGYQLSEKYVAHLIGN
jgi:hypothetical protein